MLFVAISAARRVPLCSGIRLRQRRYARCSVVAMGRRAAKNADRKGKTDSMKAKLYGKYGKLVLLAAYNRAKAGGANPDNNKTLASTLEQAKRAGVPKDILDRNLKRAQDKSASDLTEVVLEAYGPGGTGFVFECLTDNKTRASTEVWTVIKKRGGKMADAGSVLFNFERRGEICVHGVSEEEAFDAATEAGAEDVEALVDDRGAPAGFRIVSAVDSFGSVRDAIGRLDWQVSEEASGLAYKPLALVEVDDDATFHANEEMLERCLELDDVDAVYTTCADIGRNK